MDGDDVDALARWKDLLTIVAIVFAWGVSIVAWVTKQSKNRARTVRTELRSELDGATKRLETSINGVGARVDGLEVTSGRQEVALDRLDSDARVADGERKVLLEKLVELKVEQTELKKTLVLKDERLSATLTSIQVGIGKLETKVDILLVNKETLHD
jgi:predicted  nucleic acid-binding Zn-ribbon protein